MKVKKKRTGLLIIISVWDAALKLRQRENSVGGGGGGVFFFLNHLSTEGIALFPKMSS